MPPPHRRERQVWIGRHDLRDLQAHGRRASWRSFSAVVGDRNAAFWLEVASIYADIVDILRRLAGQAGVRLPER
jgi:hypothetical protein